MRNVFQVGVVWAVTEALSSSASPRPSHSVDEDNAPSTYCHISPHFSSHATQKPGVKRRPVDNMTKENDNQFHLQLDEK
jgi:hypothetical protein